jgi:hypothetical protein
VSDDDCDDDLDDHMFLGNAKARIIIIIQVSELHCVRKFFAVNFNLNQITVATTYLPHYDNADELRMLLM